MRKIFGFIFLFFFISTSFAQGPWTAVIDSVAKNPDGLTLTVAYHVTDGISTISKTEPLVSNSDPTAIKQLAQNLADYQNKIVAQKAAQAAVDPTKIVGTVNLVPPPPPPPTQQQIDESNRQVAFSAAWVAYEECHLKLVTKCDEPTLLSAAQALYKTGDLSFRGGF